MMTLKIIVVLIILIKNNLGKGYNMHIAGNIYNGHKQKNHDSN